MAIGLREPTQGMREMLDAALRPLRARGSRVQLREARRGSLLFLTCQLEGEPAAGPAAREFRAALAAALAAFIVQRREPELLRRVVATHYSYFEDADRQRIAALAAQQLGSTPEARRRDRVLQRLGEYLQRQCTVVVDGFVTFRLKDYVDELVGAVDRAVDDYLLEREYREFVELLRHVVASQNERPAVAHCLLAGAGFELEDDGGRRLGAEFLEEAEAAAASRDVSRDDLLVSALITLAPRAIRVHVPAAAGGALSADALATLEAVFPKAVSVCRGCARCRRSAQGE